MSKKALFLYRKDLKLTKAELADLRSMGYVPIGVDDFEQVRIRQAEEMTVTDRMKLQIALDTIKASAFSSVKEGFGRRLAREMTGDPNF